MSVTFANPWMLWGAAAVLAPLIIHLLTRSTPKTLWFPTLRFLRRSVARQSRLLRWRHLLLMLLRALLLTLLALAFARPHTRLPVQQALASGVPATVIIAVDVSMSMGYSGPGVTPLQRAKTEAEHILRQLSARDAANVLWVSAKPEFAAARPTRDMRFLRQALHKRQVTAERADFNAAIERILAVSDQTPDRPLQVYFVSDFQRSNWADVRLEALPATMPFFLVDVDEGAKPNLAVTKVQVRPPVARVGLPCEIVCQVSNFSSAAQQTTLLLQLDDEEPGRRALLIPAFGSANAVFRTRFTAAGVHGGVARISPDALPADDSRSFAIECRKALQAWIVSDEETDDTNGAAFYLARALNPFGADSSLFRVTMLEGYEASSRTWVGPDVVLLAGLRSNGDDLAAPLLNYVRQGGCVVHFLTTVRARRQLQAWDDARSESVSPITVGQPLNVSFNGRGYVAFAEARLDSAALRWFRDRDHGDLTRFHFNWFHRVEKVDPLAEVLLRFDDGTVAAARRRVGEGTLVVCNFSPAPSASDMQRQPAFPPFVHELIRGSLADDASPLDFAAGDLVTLSLPAAERSAFFSGVAPDGERLEVVWRRLGDQVVVSFESTDLCGLYGVLAGEKRVGLAAVNPAEEESDLRDLDGAELVSRRNLARRAAVLGGAHTEQQIERLRHGRPLWPWLLLAVLALAVVEQWAAWRLRPRE